MLRGSHDRLFRQKGTAALCPREYRYCHNSHILNGGQHLMGIVRNGDWR